MAKKPHEIIKFKYIILTVVVGRHVVTGFVVVVVVVVGRHVATGLVVIGCPVVVVVVTSEI